MLFEEQQRILMQLQSGLDENTTPLMDGIIRVPVDEYTCPDRLAKEQQIFFRDTPLLLGASPDLPAPNSYLATSEAGVPILMTRDNEGQFRAFLNVCRHRGMQVIPDGRGTKTVMTCPFHAWSYSNSGKLISINREERFGCVDKDELGLVELPAHEHSGMLWVKPSPGGDFGVEETLGGLASEFESWGLASHYFSEEQILEADINWKLAIDTFGENYHFDVLHKETLASEIQGNLQTSDAFGRNYRMVFATKGGFRYVRENNIPMAQWPYRLITLNVYFIYPNTILLVDIAGIDILRMYPDSNNPAKSRTHHRYYSYQGFIDYMKQNDQPIESRLPGFNRVVLDEDYHAAESTQIGASSGAQTHYLFGRNEPALHHYHNTHREGLGLPEIKMEPG